jgi:hypothetical protein
MDAAPEPRQVLNKPRGCDLELTFIRSLNRVSGCSQRRSQTRGRRQPRDAPLMKVPISARSVR